MIYEYIDVRSVSFLLHHDARCFTIYRVSSRRSVSSVGSLTAATLTASRHIRVYIVKVNQNLHELLLITDTEVPHSNLNYSGSHGLLKVFSIVMSR
jgi:hypothetical protein